jgi:hypothetical protein
MTRLTLAAIATLLLFAPAFAADTIKRADQRFAKPDVQETPNFQRHVLPLMGRLGCNGRACHGSFQGQGGFRLSLFGYDFKADLDALTKGDSPRTDTEVPDDSLILQKPTLATPHKGGKRMETDGWQYRVFKKWIEGGAKGVGDDNPHFVRLEVTPPEIVFKKTGETTQIKVIAHWSDGAAEDVTPLCRYRTNDESIAEIDADGRVKSLGKGDTAVVAFYDNGIGVTQIMLPVSDKVGKEYPKVPTPTKIDELVVDRLRKLGMVPSDQSEDAEFLRRVSLDVTGTLPAPDEITAFLADRSSDKRAKKIDELLERPTYPAWWATLLCDITGNNPRAFQQLQPVNGQIPAQWYSWIQRRLKENTPYDEIIKGMVLASSRKPDQSYEDFVKEMATYFSPEGHKDHKDFAERPNMPYYWARNTVRSPDDMALNFSYTFLGVRLQCAQCHKHPFDQWTQNDFKGFSAFFDRMQFNVAPDARELSNKLEEEIGLKGIKDNKERQNKLSERVKNGDPIPWREVFVQPVSNANRGQGKGNQKRGPANQRTPKVLGGDEVTEQLADPRTALMEWMLEKDNPYFARAIVNRVWAHYFGVGIIDPPDDLNLANPPSNPALLDYLTDAFVEHGYDLKWLHRAIAGSRTYQLTWRPNDTNKYDTRNFSHASVRRLPAEVAFDAIVLATAGADQLKQLHGDPSLRAIADPRSNPRGGGGKGQNPNYALRVFGQPERATACDCERSTEPSLTQSLYLMNDQELFTLLDRGNGRLAELGRQVQAAATAAEREKKDAENDGDGTGDKERQRRAADRVKYVAQRIKQLREEGNTEEAEHLEKKLAAFRQEANDADGKAKSEAKSEKAPSSAAATLDTEQLVREMYLRTLSRFPTDQEMSRSREYLASSRDPVSGVGDVLWALLNTKEFIVNH